MNREIVKIFRCAAALIHPTVVSRQTVGERSAYMCIAIERAIRSNDFNSNLKFQLFALLKDYGVPSTAGGINVCDNIQPTKEANQAHRATFLLMIAEALEYEDFDM